MINFIFVSLLIWLEQVAVVILLLRLPLLLQLLDILLEYHVVLGQASLGHLAEEGLGGRVVSVVLHAILLQRGVLYSLSVVLLVLKIVELSIHVRVPSALVLPDLPVGTVLQLVALAVQALVVVVWSLSRWLHWREALQRGLDIVVLQDLLKLLSFLIAHFKFFRSSVDSRYWRGE